MPPIHSHRGAVPRRTRRAAVAVVCHRCRAAAPPGPVQRPGPTAADQEAARLEIDLVRYKDTSPEAAEILVRLVDLYHANGRVFGLVRTAQKFITVHPADKRHKAVMLKLLDALESLSRNQELIAACRQFLERYPNEPESAAIEVRLARTLERTPERLRTAGAWRTVWQRQPGTPDGRQAGARASVLCELLRSAEALQLAADLAGDMLDKLPPGPLVGEVGYRAFGMLCAANQPAKANALAAKMLAKGGITDQRLLRDVHQRMSLNYQALGQFANAVESLRKAQAIEATRRIAEHADRAAQRGPRDARRGRGGRPAVPAEVPAARGPLRASSLCGPSLRERQRSSAGLGGVQDAAAPGPGGPGSGAARRGS